MSVMDAIFDPEVEDFYFHFEFPFGTQWTKLFDTCCVAFIHGCMKTSNKITFDDLLFVKSRLKKCNVLCEINTHSFEDSVRFPLTLFAKVAEDSMETSFLQILGDAVYRIKFVPRFRQQETVTSGCMA